MKLLFAKKGVKPDCKDRYGQTPISWAAMKGHEAVVKLLVERDDVAADSTLRWSGAAEGHEGRARISGEAATREGWHLPQL